MGKKELTDEQIANEYTLSRPERFRVTNRITHQTYEASAFSADEACKKLGWVIGDCFIEELRKNS